jgi:hypothetical protein
LLGQPLPQAAPIDPHAAVFTSAVFEPSDGSGAG